MAATVRDNPDESRYEIHDDDQLAGVGKYRLHGDTIDLTHTETDEAFAGRGLGKTLARGILDDVRSRGLAVRPFCPFIRKYIDENPEYLDLVRADDRERFELPAA